MVQIFSSILSDAVPLSHGAPCSIFGSRAHCTRGASVLTCRSNEVTNNLPLIIMTAVTVDAPCFCIPEGIIRAAVTPLGITPVLRDLGSPFLFPYLRPSRRYWRLACCLWGSQRVALRSAPAPPLPGPAAAGRRRPVSTNQGESSIALPGSSVPRPWYPFVYVHCYVLARYRFMERCLDDCIWWWKLM